LTFAVVAALNRPPLQLRRRPLRYSDKRYAINRASEQVSAHYDKGVLKINLAKKAEAKPKQDQGERRRREDPGSQSLQQQGGVREMGGG